MVQVLHVRIFSSYLGMFTFQLIFTEHLLTMVF